MKFVCPKCSLPLLESGGVAKCQGGHSFDRARGGYYNLLLSNGAKTHGDNVEMVEARRAFLDTGAYFPLADRIAELVSQYATGDILDIGCGEGYYTDIMEKRLTEHGFSSSVVGFDISKDAVRHAARRNKNLELAVASAYKIPVSDGAFSLAVNMFSPLALEETRRALFAGGIFIMAVPGEEHLWGLKSKIYDTPYKNELAGSALSGFELVSSERISYSLKLSSPQEVRSLFMMTPYAYRTSAEGRARVMALSELETEVSFVIFVYKRL